MNFNDFDKKLQKAALESKSASGLPLTKKVAATALRFVDDNFRSQSWEGVAWEKSSEDGTTLIKTGALKRSFNQDCTDTQVRTYSNVKYARVHNEGFNGSEKVSAHTRGVYTKKVKGKRTKTGSVKVKSFTRIMNIKQRQYAPYEGHESPTLNKQVETIITDHVQDFFKQKLQ
jgi:phage gpG-like protein